MKIEMGSAKKLSILSFEDYLAGETTANRKHEFVDGEVYMMVGGSYAHNLISANVLAELHAQLKGSPCRAMNSDNKVRVETATRQRGYYPDVFVTCGDDIRQEVYQDRPRIIFEVLSKSTRRKDMVEKREAYESFESLEYYILLEQHFAAAIVYRRNGEQFERSYREGLDAVIELPEINASLLLSDVYAEVDFSNADQLREEDVAYEVLGSHE
jgi:Uma2 family endonuclease